MSVDVISSDPFRVACPIDSSTPYTFIFDK